MSANIAIPPTAASTPKRSPATPAARTRPWSGWTAGRPASTSIRLLDDVDAVRGLIAKGEIVAIKGLGGFHLACDATNAEVVARLRQLKRRDAKPFALMARDLDVIRRYCSVGLEEERALASAAAPIVLLRADGAERLPDEVAPGLATLGFMLPTTPLHLLILARMERPVVMTSGNVSDEPQVIDEEAARDTARRDRNLRADA